MSMQEKELIIIGSGPAGLRAAQEARENGIDYLLLEKGDIGQAWREIRPEMPMLSPNHPQRDWTSISPEFPIWKLDVKRPFCSAAEFVQYLEKYADHMSLNISTGTEVKRVVNENGHYAVFTSKGDFRSRAVFNASGFFGNPYIPNIPGMRGNPIVTHSHNYISPEPFKGKRVFVIGGGNSAAEIALDLLGHSQIYLVTRGELQFFSQTKNLCHIRGISESLLKEMIAMELIHYIPKVEIRKMEDNVIFINDDSYETHHVIAATGYRPVISHLSDLKLKYDQRSKFPLINETGEAKGARKFYLGGPLGYSGLRSLFIHGFIRDIPVTIQAIKDQLQRK